MAGMRTWTALCFAAALSAGAAAGDADRVATVIGEDISRSELPAAADDAGQARGLLELVWRRIAPHYIARKGLAATQAEVAELAAYDREFSAKDRAQRARKLEELNQRLATEELGAADRARLEEFRAVLARMASRDAERDRLPPPDPDRQAASYSPWVEMWKMNKALYQQYGGIVALTRFGHDPHGARAALLADYERQGLLRISDARLRERVFALLQARPSMVVPAERVDFTPYWKRPIPPSYFPD